MNKKLIKEKKFENGCINRYYTEEFNPQDVKMIFFDYYGNPASEDDKDDVRSYSFEASVKGIDPLEVRRVTFPEFDYRSNEVAKVIVEYEQCFDSSGNYMKIDFNSKSSES